MQQTRDSVADIWGARTPCAGEWPARADERVVEQPDRWVQSACALCSNGCGMDIGVKDGRIVGVRGRATDIANRGRLGPKGLHGWEANNSPDRLTRPLIRRGDRLESASWDEAMELLVGRSRELLARHTGLSIGIYSTGQLFLEEYYTLALIARAGLRTPHADGNTRLCTAPTLVSTVLQGVYQSHQATAAAVQVNNLQLIRGLIGKPGAGVLQMNGQPTSQNTRETGAAEVLPGFRKFQNPRHIADLARVWNVDPESIPRADRDRGCRALWDRRWRHGRDHLAARHGAGAGPRGRYRARRGIHPLPLRLLGPAGSPACGKRADHHGLGSREQAAPLQVRGGTDPEGHGGHAG